MPSKVFLSYSHQNQPEADEVEAQLSSLRQEGLIEYWRDQWQLRPGDDWYEDIIAGLRESDIAVVLLSKELVASEFVSRVELPSLLRDQAVRGLGIVPFLLEECRHRRVIEQQILNPKEPWREQQKPRRAELLERLRSEVLRQASWTLVVEPPEPTADDRRELAELVTALREGGVACRVESDSLPGGDEPRAATLFESRPVVVAVNASPPAHLERWKDDAERLFVFRLSSQERFPSPPWIRNGHDLQGAGALPALLAELRRPEIEGAESRRKLAAATEREIAEAEKLADEVFKKLGQYSLALWLGDGRTGLRHSDLSKGLLRELSTAGLKPFSKTSHFPPALEVLASIVAATRGRDVPTDRFHHLLENGVVEPSEIADGVAQFVAALNRAQRAERLPAKPLVIVSTSPSLDVERALCREKVAFARLVLDRRDSRLHVTDLTRYVWSDGSDHWWVTERRSEKVDSERLADILQGQATPIPHLFEGERPAWGRSLELCPLGLRVPYTFTDSVICKEYNEGTIASLDLRRASVFLLKCFGTHDLMGTLGISAEESLRALELRTLIPEKVLTAVREAVMLMIGCRLFDNDLRVVSSMLLSRSPERERYWLLPSSKSPPDDYDKLERALWGDQEMQKNMELWLHEVWRAKPRRLEPARVLDHLCQVVEALQ